MTKVMLFNLPSGPAPTDFPPIAISRVMEGIGKSLGFDSCDVRFMNLDYYRPSFGEIKAAVEGYGPDIVAFSGILTPAYAYLKKLSVFIGDSFPAAIQVLGGQMAVISNIILMKTRVDFCVIGESEPAFSNLIRRLRETGFSRRRMDDYAGIKNLVFLRDGLPFFTGFGDEDYRNGMRQFNFDLLSKHTSLENYIHPMSGQYFRDRALNSGLEGFLELCSPENRDKNMVTVFASKGCVNTCTFCHRFYKGYKINETDDVIDHIEKLRRELNVGMVLFQEENFGTNKGATARLVEYLRKSGLNWGAGAVRVKAVNDDVVREWKAAGCVHINFGIESLSQKMLDVMEKRTTVAENIEAVRLCHKYRIFTVVGLVVGMPGETEETIEETVRNLPATVPDDLTLPFEINVNYVQAIPGTPVYEYAKRTGLMGTTIDEEELYIERLYEANAGEMHHYLNFTQYPVEELGYWNYYINMEVVAAYIRKSGHLKVALARKTRPYRIGLVYALAPRAARRLLLKYAIVARSSGFSGLARVMRGKAAGKMRSRGVKGFSDINTSLRKVVAALPARLRDDEVSTAAFKAGH